jgi:hypothetical protein
MMTFPTEWKNKQVPNHQPYRRSTLTNKRPKKPPVNQLGNLISHIFAGN